MRLLSTATRWRMPERDLGVDPSPIPARPAIGVVLDRLASVPG